MKVVPLGAVKQTQLVDIQTGECFKSSARAVAIYMKLGMPTKLYNSRTISEVINRGSFFCVDISTGMIHVIKGDCVAYPVNMVAQEVD